MAPIEPQKAADYDDRTTAAVRSVLLEIGQILGSFHGKFAVIGGAVPWLLLEGAEMPHVGTGDVDLSLDAEALGDGEYARLVESLQRHDYHQRESLRRFQLVRTVSARDGGPDIDVVVDFLMPREAEIVRNTTPLVSDFAVQRADGADLALRFHEVIQIEGTMPDGGANRVRILVASIPALLAMKGHAVRNRLKHKDAYDIYYCVRNFPGGLDALVAATSPLLDVSTAKNGYLGISETGVGALLHTPQHVVIAYGCFTPQRLCARFVGLMSLRGSSCAEPPPSRPLAASSGRTVGRASAMFCG